MLCERPCLVYPLLLDLPDRTETCRRQPGPWATENTCDRRGGTEGRRGWSVCTLSSKAMIFYKPCPSSHLEATGISGGMPELAGLHSRNRTPRPHRGDRSDLGASLMGVVHFGNLPPGRFWSRCLYKPWPRKPWGVSSTFKHTEAAEVVSALDA